MSSRIENASAFPPASGTIRVKRAQSWLSLSHWLGYGAATAGLGLVAFYSVELGLFDRTTPVPGIAATTVENPDQVSGRNATIAGTGNNDQPFEVTAAQGLQDADLETLVHLKTVNGMFQRPNGANLNVTATRARYNSVSKALELQGQVVFDEKDRFTATMEGAEVNTETQVLVSRSPVTVTIIGGVITADSFTVSEQGERILFKGGVKARFVTEGAQSGDGLQ